MLLLAGLGSGVGEDSMMAGMAVTMATRLQQALQALHLSALVGDDCLASEA